MEVKNVGKALVRPVVSPGASKSYIILYIVLFLFYLSAAGCSSPSGAYRVYVINNAEFGISANKTNARATTDGFNRAIEKARGEGYTGVRFAAGEYLVACVSDVTTYPTDGIFLYSNMTFDLGEAVFYVEPNGSHSYGVFQLERLENVTITGGRIIGDKDEHDYSPTPKGLRHIYGSAFHILSCENVLIRNVKMSAFTGMAIRIYANSEMNMYQMFPMDTIRITGCEFDDCGMNGIEISHALHVEIDHNRFTNFSNHVGSTNPWGVCGILTVRWKDDREDRYDKLTKDIKIHDNYFENCGGAVAMFNGEDSEISDNYSEGGMIGIYAGHRMKIHRNTVVGEYIQFREGDVYYNEDICVPVEGANKNDCELRNAGIIHQTGNFPCD
jgi:hypothetical protein